MENASALVKFLRVGKRNYQSLKEILILLFVREILVAIGIIVFLLLLCLCCCKMMSGCCKMMSGREEKEDDVHNRVAMLPVKLESGKVILVPVKSRSSQETKQVKNYQQILNKNFPWHQGSLQKKKCNIFYIWGGSGPVFVTLFFSKTWSKMA